MADTPAMARLRGGHYNTSDWNASTNPGGMGGDGHRYAMIPPKAPQTPTYPVMVNDMVAVADEVAASANAAAGSASAAAGSAGSAASALSSTQSALNDARLLLSNATLDGTSDCSTTMNAAADPKGLTVATNKAFRPGHEVQATRKSSPTTWLRGTVTDYNPGTGALYVNMTSVSAPNGIGPFSDWTISTVSRQDAMGGATVMAMTGDLTLTNASTRVQALDPNGADRIVTLPAANSLPNAGGPIHIIRHSGTSNALTIRNSAGTTLAGLLPQQSAMISCLNRGTAAGAWTVDMFVNDASNGIRVISGSADYAMTAGGPRILRCTPDGLGRIITLPDATTLGASGSPVAYIINHSNTFSLSIRAAAGTPVLATIAPGQTATVHLLDRSTVQGAWYIFVNTPAVANETLVGVTTSGRIALTSTSGINNHKLSATATAGKVIWSYGRLNNLCVRVLTIVGRNVTVGAENILTTMMADGCGQAVALSDTYGIATFCSGNDVYSQGFSINLSTNVCTLSGSSNAWGVGSGYFAEIRMDRVPGQNGAISVVRRPSDAASILRLASYNGSTLSASSIAVGSAVELASRHDITAVSSTEARHYCRNSSRLYGRPITLSVPSMTISLGSVVDSGADSTDIFAASADTTWSVTFYQDGSAYGAYARAWTGSLAGPQVTLSAVNQARHGALVMWNSTSGMFLYSDYAGGSNQLYLQDFTLAGGSPYITVDAAKKRLLNASAGLAQSNGSHLAAALTLSPTSGLLLFNDEGNSNYPTIVVVERSV